MILDSWDLGVGDQAREIVVLGGHELDDIVTGGIERRTVRDQHVNAYRGEILDEGRP